MLDEHRRDFANLMLLCPNHHRLIDSLEVEAHSIEALSEMKLRHEEHCNATQWWQSEDQLDHFVDLAIEMMTTTGMAQDADRLTGTPQLIVYKIDDKVQVENRGNIDAVGIALEPVGDDGDLLRTDEPPGRISPGGVWQAGFHIQTFGSSGPQAVRLTYKADDGRVFSGEFPL